jgi:hypothetical protein
MIMQVETGLYDDPSLGILVGLVTFPPALMATIISLLLVGPRHCKLAWISLSVYPATFALGILAAIIDSAIK